jgi:hypothetical protein
MSGVLLLLVLLEHLAMVSELDEGKPKPRSLIVD